MRYAIIGDIHSNLEALSAVFKDIDGQGIDSCYCIGDLVGYGAEPVAVLEWVRDRSDVIVAGNHDHAMSGILPLSHFNEFARQAAEWTIDQLYDEHIQMLRRLPVKKSHEELTLVHATLSAPSEFNYIMNESHARKNFEALDTRIGFVGHSHVPMNFLERDRIRFSTAEKVNVEDDLRLIVNVGSVGQPRDEDPRASYAIYDDNEEMIYIRRVEYDIESAAEKIKNAGLPPMLAERLFEGR